MIHYHVTGEAAFIEERQGVMKVIFLDIDGVLQPSTNQKRFDVDRKETAAMLAKQYCDDIYTELDEYDVAAVYCDWDVKAVGLLKECMDKTGARIVLSSDWRETRSRRDMLALLRLHGLDGYYEDQLLRGMKKDVIKEYIAEHTDGGAEPILESYVVIDDLNMTFDFGTQMVNTRYTFTGIDAEHVIDALNMRYRFMENSRCVANDTSIENIGKGTVETSSRPVFTGELYDKDRMLCRITMTCLTIGEEKVSFILYNGEPKDRYQIRLFLYLSIGMAKEKFGGVSKHVQMVDCDCDKDEYDDHYEFSEYDDRWKKPGVKTTLRKVMHGSWIETEVCDAKFLHEGNIFTDTYTFFRTHKEEIQKATEEMYPALIRYMESAY